MMAKKPPVLHESPSQTAGPYVHIGLVPVFSGIEGVYREDPGSRMVGSDTRGQRIAITGCVYDGEGAAVTDALIEIWQADEAGLYPSSQETRGSADPNFAGWGRCAADPKTGEYRFDTIKPGALPDSAGNLAAPHVTFWIVARGINIGLHTRLYFDDEQAANTGDPLLAAVEPRERAATLLARSEGDNRYRFDIFLQGPRETVFLDI
jgi:protocatechuate 3,4-dioxygenase alpha subunit